MYRKKSRGWYKHKDFILIDLICLFLSLLIAHLIRNGSVQSLFRAGIYRNMISFVILADLFLIIIFESFVRNMFATWWRAFRSSSNFRRTFLLAFYTAMILLRTVLNREIWFDPLGKLFGGWGLYEEGQFTTESIENFMLFVPFSILLLWTFQKELLDESENIRFGKTVWEATKVVAVFSFLIEFTQLLFHLGTFQISDLVYNTLGGAVGGVIYYLRYCRKRKNKMRNRGQLSEH